MLWINTWKKMYWKVSNFRSRVAPQVTLSVSCKFFNPFPCLSSSLPPFNFPLRPPTPFLACLHPSFNSTSPLDPQPLSFSFKSLAPCTIVLLFQEMRFDNDWRLMYMIWKGNILWNCLNSKDIIRLNLIKICLVETNLNNDWNNRL